MHFESSKPEIRFQAFSALNIALFQPEAIGEQAILVPGTILSVTVRWYQNID